MSRSSLSLFFLGAPQIELNGAPVAVDTRKAIALLAYLAVTDEGQSRDRLAALLWPDYDQSRARAALRRTLSALNKSLGGVGLKIDRERIALDGSVPIWLDVASFRSYLAACRDHEQWTAAACSTCVDSLAEAVALYRDDFLAGFSLRDSPAFDDWQFFQAESLRRELAEALEKLAHCLSLEGRFEPAIDYARRWLALDPLHEAAHRQLMQLYAWAGQRTAALRQYRECVRILEEELGVPPLEETTALYEHILSGAVGPRSQETGERRRSGAAAQRGTEDFAPAPVHSRSQTPLVGREAEFNTLLSLYETMQADGRIVVLEGEAGIGKTRLAEEFLAHIRARGAATWTTRCYEGETNLAYGPFIEGLRPAVNNPDQASALAQVPVGWLHEAARLLPELVPRSSEYEAAIPILAPLDSPGAQSRFFEAVVQVLLTLYGSQPPGVLFFDDLHWADEASLDLLTYLVRRLRGRPLYILVSWRGTHLSAGHRLRQLLAEVQRMGTGALLPLSRLSRPAVKAFAQAAAPTLADGLDERLYEETEGIPFFLVEYLALVTSGLDAANQASWPVPGSVRDLLHSRLRSVSETGWQLLNTAAAIGRSFDFDILREASGRSDEETITALEGLIAQGLVEELASMKDEGRGANSARLTYDFGHEKLREVVYEETSLARRRLLHRRVAEVLAGRARSKKRSFGSQDRFGKSLYSEASQIAYHYQLAGQEEKAAEYFKLAGDHARALFANAEALAHYRAALALGYPNIALLHEAIGDLLVLSGLYGKAIKSLETAAALSLPENLPAIEHKLGRVYHRRGDWEVAESHYQAALVALPDSGDLPPGDSGGANERAGLYADWSLTAHHRGQAERALELAQQALAMAEAAGDRLALARAHNILGILCNSLGKAEEAGRYLEQSLALAEALGAADARVAALNNLALVYGSRGEGDRALELARTALELSVARGDRHREAALHNNLADLLHAAGRTEEAMDHLKQSVTIYAEIGVEAGAWQPEIWKLTEW